MNFYTMSKHNTNDNSVKDLRSRYIRARVTESEYVKISHLSKQCGLTLSNYFRKCVLGQHPKNRLTEKEVEALNSLADARGDVVKIANALNGRSQEERKRYFGNQRFMEQWIIASIRSSPDGMRYRRTSLDKLRLRSSKILNYDSESKSNTAWTQCHQLCCQ